MADYQYNDSIGQADFGTGQSIGAVAQVLGAALEERERLKREIVDFTASLVLPTDTVLRTNASIGFNYARHGFRDFFARLYEIAVKSCRKYNSDGSDYDIANAVVIDSVLKGSDGCTYVEEYNEYGFLVNRVEGDRAQNLPFPFDPDGNHGWQRLWRREIWSMSYPGEEGQRARFIATQNMWFSAPFRSSQFTGPQSTTGGYNGTFVYTPTGEIPNSGKYYEYTSGVWVESEDQTTPSDLCRERIVITQSEWIGLVNRFPFPGDLLIDPENNTCPFVDDFTKALNQCTRRLLYYPNYPAAPSSLTNINATSEYFPSVWLADPQDTSARTGNLYFASGGNLDRADAEDTYEASRRPYGVGDFDGGMPESMCQIWRTIAYGFGAYPEGWIYYNRYSQKMRYIIPFLGNPNTSGSTMQASVSVYVWPTAPMVVRDDEVGGYFPVYDSFGLGWEENKWNLGGTSTLTLGDSPATTITVGTLDNLAWPDVPPTLDTDPVTDEDGFTSYWWTKYAYRGFKVTRVAFLVDLEVANGLTYTE